MEQVVEAGSIITSGAVIIAIVNQVKNAVPKEHKKVMDGIVSFILALVLGVVFGALKWFGLTGVESGIISALVSSGAVTLKKK